MITGGATGIGAACAKLFAENGFDIALNVRTRTTDGHEVATTCQQHGARCILLIGDVTADVDCRKMAAQSEAEFGRLDALINSAGITKLADGHDLEALDRADFERIFAVNLIGAFQMVRATRAMLAATSGAVVNVSSHSGFSGYGSSLAYAASKGALNTLTLGLARSLAPEIRVNAVCPGFVDTQWLGRHMPADAFAAFRSRVSSQALLDRVVSPDDVARTVFWFAAEATAATGLLFVLDAGVHLNISQPV
jgi:NAD(P)-dependent dehydrogenase (short-subunit alcohol dehydrogenase family)